MQYYIALIAQINCNTQIDNTARFGLYRLGSLISQFPGIGWKIDHTGPDSIGMIAEKFNVGRIVFGIARHLRLLLFGISGKYFQGPNNPWLLLSALLTCLYL
jgi:hypothetical protein